MKGIVAGVLCEGDSPIRNRGSFYQGEGVVFVWADQGLRNVWDHIKLWCRVVRRLAARLLDGQPVQPAS